MIGMIERHGLRVEYHQDTGAKVVEGRAYLAKWLDELVERESAFVDGDPIRLAMNKFASKVGGTVVWNGDGFKADKESQQ